MLGLQSWPRVNDALVNSSAAALEPRPPATQTTCELHVDDMRDPGRFLPETMNYFHALSLLTAGLVGTAGCGSGNDSSGTQAPSSSDVEALNSRATILDLDDVKTNPDGYDWFDFRPNVEKLILSGAAETEHVAILWYTVMDGSVGLHFHSKTESVYVIDGTQTDAKGVYPTGTAYFNPPGSGHAIMNSSGFFILAYASPPDFAATDLIQEYTPLRIDTAASDLMSAYPFELEGTAVRKFDAPLNNEGGMSAQFIEITSPEEAYDFGGNYLLVLAGRCDIEGVAFGEQTLVVAKTIEPQPFKITSSENSSCLAMAVSFATRT
jgi:hypothetical protein